MKKNFVGVDVADASDQPLVHQDRFHRAPMFREHLLKFRKIDIECIRSEVALFQKFIDILDKSDFARFT
jgi:hypothetical protein